MTEVTQILGLGGQQLVMDFDPEIHTQLDVIDRALLALQRFENHGGKLTVDERARFIDKVLRARLFERAKAAYIRLS